MIVKHGYRPLIKREETIKTQQLDRVLMLFLLLVLPFVHYGPRVLTLTACTVAACCIAEAACSLLARKPTVISDFAPVVMGMTISMLVPVTAPLWLPALAGVFGVVVIRAPFGGTGRTPFHPAAAGVAFVTLCWPDLVFAYPDPEKVENLPLFLDCAVDTVRSPAAVLHEGYMPNILPYDMLWGKFAGPMGTTAIVVICACALYLFFRRTADWRITVSFVAVAALFAVLFPRIISIPITSLKYELLSGSLLFCAVFLMTQSETAPRTNVGKLVFGAAGGLLLMLFRMFGAFEQGAVFVVLLMNAIAPVIDYMVGKIRMKGENKREADAKT